MRSVAVFWCNAEPKTAGTAKNASALRLRMRSVAVFSRNAEGVKRRNSSYLCGAGYIARYLQFNLQDMVRRFSLLLFIGIGLLLPFRAICQEGPAVPIIEQYAPTPKAMALQWHLSFLKHIHLPRVPKKECLLNYKILIQRQLDMKKDIL